MLAATFLVGRCLYYVDFMDTRAPGAAHTDAERHVTALYQAHALSLARLALLMLGDADAAQDVVQDAFFGLLRTLDVNASGGTLLADSRVVWSQDVPASPLTAREKNTILTLEPTSHACDTPFLTGNGQVVVCGNNTYSTSDKRLSVVWLAYPLAAPTRPRVLGTVQEPQDVSAVDGAISVDWTNSSGTEIISNWNPTVLTGPTNNPVASGYNDDAYIGHGTVTMFPPIGGAFNRAW